MESDGSAGWSRLQVLCLYRLRRRFRRRPRRQRNPQRDMPIGILGSLVDLHAALRPGVRRTDRPGELPQHWTSADPVAVGIDVTGVDLGEHCW